MKQTDVITSCKGTDTSTTVHLHVGSRDTAKDHTFSSPGKRSDKNAAASMVAQVTKCFSKLKKPGERGTAKVYTEQEMNFSGSNRGITYKGKMSVKQLHLKSVCTLNYTKYFACDLSPDVVIIEKHRPKDRRKAKYRVERSSHRSQFVNKSI